MQFSLFVAIHHQKKKKNFRYIAFKNIVLPRTELIHVINEINLLCVTID